MSQLTPNPLQEVNLPAKPCIHNGAQDRYWGLDICLLEQKKTIVYFNLGGKESDTKLANQKKEKLEEHN